MQTQRTDAYLNVVRASLAADERIDADQRQRFATMPASELADIWSLVTLVQSLPERERETAMRIAQRLADGDRELLKRIQAANRGEVSPEAVIAEVGRDV